MPISLPTCPMPTDYQVLLRDFGSVMTPFLGGPEQRINRVGTRFGLKLDMPPLDADDGMVYLSRLLQGRSDRVLLPWPLLDFDPGDPGTPLIASAIAGGSIISLKGLTAGYTVQEGQFFSIIHGGRRYVEMFTSSATADGSGNIASATIFPMLRTSLSINDVVEIETPIIEGHVLPGEELSWQIDLSNARAFSFSVMEAA
ncbi:MAG: hypothetical protein EP345_17485 [Sphingomonadales bacterium]|nr:MAG: hypothetical protein EP345_17485 [Sphingomonadales bacterium]